MGKGAGQIKHHGGKIWIPVLFQLFSMKSQREDKETLKLHN